MSTRKDHLLDRERDRRDRLNYVQGVLLDARDFEDEQRYHRGALARGLQYLFGTGTVAGLSVGFNADNDELEVEPGLALDPLGRLIEIPRRFCVGLGAWLAAQRLEDLVDSWIDEDPDDPASDPVLIADVFVRFVVCERGKTPAFASGPFDALDAVTPARLRDGFELGLILRPEARVRREAIIAEVAPVDLPALPGPDALSRAVELLTMAPSPRLEAIHDDILDAWREGTQLWENDRPPRLPEHLQPRVVVLEQDPLAVGRDPSSVLLARMRIPVTPPVDIDTAPTRRPGLPSLDERFRRFVYGPGMLTHVATSGET